jgi:23S rRNA (uracil1939-C5)-methyltransferase
MAERLVIDRLGHHGDGVFDGAMGAVFIPGTLPGETVEVEEIAEHSDRRRLLRIDKPSPERIAPICQHFGVCGGCAVQHLQEATYRAWKRGLVVDALRQTGLESVAVGELVDAHGAGRRRAVFHARTGGKDVLTVGFSAARSHRIVAIDRCPVLAPALDGALKAAWAIAERLVRTGKPLDIHVTATEAGLDVDIRGSGQLSAPLTTALAGIAATHNLARLTRHGELIAQSRPPTLRIGKTTVLLPPAAFLQATMEGEATLASLVLKACSGAAKIADLFCGIGPFALRLAEQARVTAADQDADALAALGKAAASTPGLKPISTERRDLFKRPLLANELKHNDAVVFDPPRQGADAQARQIAQSDVPLAVAVSCSPGTFARDMAILVNGGYRLTHVTPVDQFRYTAHVEIVARLEK